MPAVNKPLTKTIMLLFCSLALNACSLFGGYQETPRVSLVSIKPMQMGLLEQRYALQLRVMNPNDTSIPMKGLNYSIDINGHEFAYGVSRQPVTIPAYSEAVLEVEVVSNLLNMMRQLREMSTEENSNLTYQLSGNISLGNRLAKLPFSVEGELNWMPADAPDSGSEPEPDPEPSSGPATEAL